MTVTDYIKNHKEWEKELGFLRLIIKQTHLVEHIKWGVPVYSLSGKNVVGVGAFKTYVGLWFYQGVFLKDKRKLLINAQEGKTQALRQWRFNSIDEMDGDLILAYINEAIKNQEQGKELKPKKKPLIIPPELLSLLELDSSLGESFEAMSLTNKRDFADYISEAKREETKQKRLDKIIPMIKEGIGLNDKYKK